MRSLRLAVRALRRAIRPVPLRHAGIPLDPFIDGAPWIPMYPPHPALRRPVAFVPPPRRPVPPRDLLARLAAPAHPER